jgi:hypothetical protein
MFNPGYPPTDGLGLEGCIARSPSGGIAARSGVSAGSASCDLFQLGGNGDLIDTGANITVYNPFALPVGGSVYILCKRVDGQWVVDAEDCG